LQPRRGRTNLFDRFDDFGARYRRITFCGGDSGRQPGEPWHESQMQRMAIRAIGDHLHATVLANTKVAVNRESVRERPHRMLLRCARLKRK
jgi:hypothetical protein